MYAMDPNKVSEEIYMDMKAKIPDVKQLFQTRHYVQCVTLCERLLMRGKSQIHPVHLSYIHFYLALSHDTMAREATIKRRLSELKLAEKHYLAALNPIIPPKPKLETLETVPEHSPDSSDDEHAPSGRRVSDASQRSLASSMTSLEDEAYVSPYNTNDSKSCFRSCQIYRAPTKKRSVVFHVPDAAVSYQEELFSADLSAFRSMIRNHLQSVRDLKEATVVPAVHFPLAPSSGDSTKMEGLRSARQRVSFRPRFDPESTQKLCSEALCELRR
ncbi:hypothetical protein P280DRAFT_159946 [Massarina eburnea CBS 473.64]|uniref:Uncharacterized protein n=1 Tax=Massarina eburnea CBS 473.64 TaxID=1395130 RepID=A0A6A6RLM8_9PLEO|nr:hypothetical protein P280DRAFT_159946 [Massarina eburnea CBS 473.64]